MIQHNIHVWQAPKGIVPLFAEVDGTQDGAASQDFQAKPALPVLLGVNLKGSLAMLAMGVSSAGRTRFPMLSKQISNHTHLFGMPDHSGGA